MNEGKSTTLRIHQRPTLDRSTLVLAFTGWMDGGDVSTGTVRRLVDLLGAQPFADIDPESFYLYHFPGPMELTALFRPHVKIEGGQVVSLDLPSNTFYEHAPANLVLFLGREPHLHWRAFGEDILELARQACVHRVLFVGSFGGAVPHTREPRLYMTCSDARLLPEMEQYGLRRSDYEGPGSFTSYLMTRAASAELEMISLVAEIPGYLQGRNPVSIEAVTRRLAKILRLPLDLEALRAESTEWELHLSQVTEKNKKLAKMLRKLERAYDEELLRQAGGEA
jgi:proteasome assembly chaperone (PAC2) family protein